MKKAALAPHCFVKKFQHLALLFLLCASLQNLNRTSLTENYITKTDSQRSSRFLYKTAAHIGKPALRPYRNDRWDIGSVCSYGKVRRVQVLPNPHG